MRQSIRIKVPRRVAPKTNKGTNKLRNESRTADDAEYTDEPLIPEPTPEPSLEGNCRRAPAVLLPSWEEVGVGGCPARGFGLCRSQRISAASGSRYTGTSFISAATPKRIPG